MQQVCSTASKKRYLFCDFKHFRVVKVAQIGLIKQEVFKKDIFVQKKIRR